MKWRDNRLVWGLARALGSATAGPEKAPARAPGPGGGHWAVPRDEADGTGRRRAFEVPVPRRFRRVRPAGPGRLFGGASAHGPGPPCHGPMELLGRPGLHWTRSLRRRTSPLGNSGPAGGRKLQPSLQARRCEGDIPDDSPSSKFKFVVSARGLLRLRIQDGTGWDSDSLGLGGGFWKGQIRVARASEGAGRGSRFSEALSGPLRLTGRACSSRTPCAQPPDHCN
jgi:hypothetical protein